MVPARLRLRQALKSTLQDGTVWTGAVLREGLANLARIIECVHNDPDSPEEEVERTIAGHVALSCREKGEIVPRLRVGKCFDVTYAPSSERERPLLGRAGTGAQPYAHSLDTWGAGATSISA